VPELLERPATREVYRADLVREVSFRLTSEEAGAESDGLTIDGYGAVFDATTHIASWEGEFDEVIARGAFRKSLRERVPVMQYDHGRHPLIGSIPLGRWDTTEEDDAGLHVVGRLSDNWLIQPIRDAIAGPEGKGGGITGMSFRFAVVKDTWTDKDGKKVRDDELLELLWYGAGDRGPLLRTLNEVKVSEVGPVAWPAYEQTSVGVRSGESPFILDIGRVDLRSKRDLSRLAGAVAAADRATPSPLPDRERQIPPGVEAARAKFRAQYPDTVDTLDGTTEPQATATPAAPHAVDTAPQGTGRAAGEHSPNRGPITRPADWASQVAAIRATIDKIERT
jgi:HK97 family phage prohead protease